MWDPYTDMLLKAFDVREGQTPGIPTIRTLAFGPDSKTLAAGGWDAVIRIFNLGAKHPGDSKEARASVKGTPVLSLPSRSRPMADR